MELADELHEKIVSLSEEGDKHLEMDRPEKALEKYWEALALLPDPKTDWEASTWLYTAIGDAHFINREFDYALRAYRTVQQCPEGLENPYVWLMIGESYFELDNMEQAREHLLRAYMLEGKDIFEDDDPKYYELISDLV